MKIMEHEAELSQESGIEVPQLGNIPNLMCEKTLDHLAWEEALRAGAGTTLESPCVRSTEYCWKGGGKA